MYFIQYITLYYDIYIMITDTVNSSISTSFIIINIINMTVIDLQLSLFLLLLFLF